jgi:hypothetical protein
VVKYWDQQEKHFSVETCIFVEIILVRYVLSGLFLYKACIRFGRSTMLGTVLLERTILHKYGFGQITKHLQVWVHSPLSDAYEC